MSRGLWLEPNGPTVRRSSALSGCAEKGVTLLWPIQPHGAVDEERLLQRRRRGDVRDEVDEQPVVGHVVREVGVRLVGAPQDAIREPLDEPPTERHDVAVCRLLAIERRWAADAQPLGASGLGRGQGAVGRIRNAAGSALQPLGLHSRPQRLRSTKIFPATNGIRGSGSSANQRRR